MRNAARVTLAVRDRGKPLRGCEVSISTAGVPVPGEAIRFKRRLERRLGDRQLDPALWSRFAVASRSTDRAGRNERYLAPGEYTVRLDPPTGMPRWYRIQVTEDPEVTIELSLSDGLPHPPGRGR